MSNTAGNIFRFTVWGQSHSAQIGVTIEGIPAGTVIDLDRLQAFLDRRRPGRDKYSTSRSETDTPEFVAGLLPFDGEADRAAVSAPSRFAIACGAPVTAVIKNADARSGDYEELRFVPRPGHADFTAMAKYGGARDCAGGGQFSGRLTAPLCITGGIALQILEKKGIRISARPVMIGGETEEAAMLEAISRAKRAGDSVGGIVECVALGVPAGLGEPMFDGIENRIAQLVFGIPAVKGIEFGAGFAAAAMKGSENNDPFCLKSRPEGGLSPQDSSPRDCEESAPLTAPEAALLTVPEDVLHPKPEAAPHPKLEDAPRPLPNFGIDPSILSRVRTATNHHGGSLGGISSGMPIVFRAAFKPTPSIAIEQDSVDVRTGKAVRLSVRGRHDPCIALRAVPVVEAAAAAAIYDLLLLSGLA